MAGFDPNEFAALKGGGAPPASAAGAFDPDEFARSKAQPAPPPQGPMMGAGEAALRGAERGVSFGFGDEARGVTAASTFEETAPSWLKDSVLRYSPLVAVGRFAEGTQNLLTGRQGAQERYEAAVAENRELQRRAMEEQPVAAFTGEVGGAIGAGLALPAIAPFRAAPTAGIIARGAAGAGNMAATGAAYGGAAGLGVGEGSLLERLPSAGTGAAVGAVAAPVVGGAINAGVGAGRMVSDQVRATTNPAALADRVLGRAVTNDAANLGRIADDMAAANVERLPARLELPDGRVHVLPEGKTIPESSPFFRFFRPAEERIGGQQYTLADAAGANTRGLAGDVARTPGPGRQPAREFLESRQFGSEEMPSAGERVAEQVGRRLGTRGAIETSDEIIARRTAQAGPAYERAHAVRLNYDSDEGQKLLGLLDRIPPEAKAEANRILRISDREGSQLIWDLGPDGGYRLASAPNTRQYDYIKQALDTAISRNRNPITDRLNPLGGALTGLKNEMLQSLDRLNPAYAAARRAFKGESELLDAQRIGLDAFKPGTTREALEESLQDLSPAEVEMVRAGAAHALRERLANAPEGADVFRLVMGTKALREKATLLIPDEASRTQFRDFLAREREMSRTFAQTRGSPTAERLGDAAGREDGIAAGLVKASAQAAIGERHGAIRTAWNTLRKINPEFRGRVMGEVRKIVFDPNPETVRSFRQRLERSQMDAETKAHLIRVVSGVVPRELVPALQ